MPRRKTAPPDPAPDAGRPAAEPDARPGWELRLESRLGLLSPIQLLVFRSYGTPDALHVRGRVTERKAVEGTTERTSTWRNVLNTLHRLESDEIPGARVRARLHGRQWETISDSEGYFVLDLEPAEPLAPGWHEVELELVESVGEPERRVERERVLVPPVTADFGVISDLDDTVIRTHATDLLQTIVTVFGGGARDRLAVPGMPAFCRALARGPRDRSDNPLFYVSNSTWNLYDLFEEFLDVNGVPPGPLFLADQRVIEAPSRALGSEHHKFDSIRTLLRTYPTLPFILVGDSGKQDPEVYESIVQNHPGRILAVYIHDVSPPERDREVQRIGESLEAQGVPLVRLRDVSQAAGHAAERGWISVRGLAEVHRELAAQRAASGDAEPEDAARSEG
jgi:phosphatidate phosphatase APP1